MKVFFIGSKFGIETKLIPKMGLKYYGISCGKFRRYHSSKILNIIDPATLVKNVSDLFKFFAGIREARAILLMERPDVVFAKGGFVSLPIGIAARLLKIPVVLHESDVVMGLANRQMARFASKVCVSFPAKNYPDIDPDKIVETGNPIREDILGGNGPSFLKSIGFDSKVKTILMMGGSQGSLFLNETLLSISRKVLEDFQLIWIAGDRDYDFINYQLKELPSSLQKRVKLYGFVASELGDIYAASDLIISRSGSNSLFEMAAVGKPGILIPYAESTGGHQLANAVLFSRTGAAYLLKQPSLTGKKLLHQVKYLLSNEKELLQMSEKMNKWASIGAADNVAKVVYDEGVRKIEQTTKDQREE